MPQPKRREPTAIDLELAKLHHRSLVQMRFADAGVAAFIIIATAVPIFAFSRVVEPLAGKNTNAKIGITTSVNVTLSLSLAANAGQAVRGRRRKKDLQEQRQYIEVLETRQGLPTKAERHRLARRDV